MPPKTIPSARRSHRDECAYCGRMVTSTTMTKCPGCQKVFHSKCYLRDSGVAKREVSKCIYCLCPTLPCLLKRKTASRNKFADQFLKNGFCVIPFPTRVNGKVTTQLLEQWNEHANTIFRGFMRAYECQIHAGSGTIVSLDNGYSNFRRRCEGRYEMITEEISKNVEPLVDNCKDIQKTLEALLSPKFKRMSSGCFYSVHGSKHQNYHTDGPPLSDVADLFPYAVNVFVPLVPVDGKNGTEFVPGSQLVSQKKTDTSGSVRPSVPVGYAILFDYRVVHRGLGNSTTTPRPCYYVTYSRSWYTDKYNFSERRYKRPLEVHPTFMETREDRMRRRLESA